MLKKLFAGINLKKLSWADFLGIFDLLKSKKAKFAGGVITLLLYLCEAGFIVWSWGTILITVVACFYLIAQGIGEIGKRLPQKKEDNDATGSDSGPTINANS
jgi:hypothetical protein